MDILFFQSKSWLKVHPHGFPIPYQLLWIDTAVQ